MYLSPSADHDSENSFKVFSRLPGVCMAGRGNTVTVVSSILVASMAAVWRPGSVSVTPTMEDSCVRKVTAPHQPLEEVFSLNRDSLKKVYSISRQSV